MGLNSALRVAGRSLEIFSAGIQVAGQNIANANTPGYVREELSIEANRPYRQGELLVGTGAETAGVRQKIDVFLETRIQLANADVQASDFRSRIYNQLELTLGELGTADLSTGLNDFLNSINDLINQPELPGLRELIVQEGTNFVNDIIGIRSDVDRLRTNANDQVEALVTEANELIDEVARLNKDILKLESAGLLQSEAGGLRTQRYDALNRLSEIIPVQSELRENGTMDVRLGTDVLVTTGLTRHLDTIVTSDRGVTTTNLQIQELQLPIAPEGGEIRGLIDGRDQILGGFIDDLDQYTSALIFEFNRIHSQGEGTVGFTTATATNRAEDTSATLNDTAATGLPFAAQHGSFEVKVRNLETGITETSIINIDLDGIGGNDTSLDDLQAALNATGNLSASITADGRLQIDAADGFDFRVGNDTSNVLAAIGINTFFTGSTSDDIGLNETITENAAYIATGRGGGPSDNSNAVELATFIDNPIEALGGADLDNFYNDTISNVALNAASERSLADGFSGFRDSLLSQRQQISGVSIDEEAIKLLEFQQSYQAAARIITTIDELFRTLINI